MPVTDQRDEAVALPTSCGSKFPVSRRMVDELLAPAGTAPWQVHTLMAASTPMKTA
jgi:hypothetical protein